MAGLYEGQPRYQEVLSYLGGRGYEIVAFHEEFIDQRTGVLLEFNAILADSRVTGLDAHPPVRDEPSR